MAAAIARLKQRVSGLFIPVSSVVIEIPIAPKRDPFARRPRCPDKAIGVRRVVVLIVSSEKFLFRELRDGPES